jgi:hypothetical protein
VPAESAPYKKNVTRGANIDLYRFPTPLIHGYDSGRNIRTYGMSIVKAPDATWIKLSVNRIIIAGRDGLDGSATCRQPGILNCGENHNLNDRVARCVGGSTCRVAVVRIGSGERASRPRRHTVWLWGHRLERSHSSSPTSKDRPGCGSSTKWPCGSRSDATTSYYRRPSSNARSGLFDHG